MGKVKVYQYTILDPDVVERRKGRRWGTREAIEALKYIAEIIESSHCSRVQRPCSEH
jgi:hypothetical protein